MPVASNEAKLRRMKMVELAQRLYEAKREVKDVAGELANEGLIRMSVELLNAIQRIETVQREIETWLDILEPYCNERERDGHDC
ncbi:MAG: hypothetical protein H0Z19_11280 [Archaeoglobus sp.]|uniref:hypothetical protein n=1 Tax=Archaeoglobus sp. TaxID=1872626 RepID=UPI001DF72077|nr:hypothetical protein [Archaeoglobus sp.]MBO8181029.1 hypothetical protein [Archaeoglobus sp.]